jgi:hypothetical protein
MPSFLADIGSAIAANALKIGLGLLLLLAAGGGGFVWGDSHASRIAVEAASKDADARVAALQKQTAATVQDYLARLSAENARGDDLAAALAKADTTLSANAAKAKETIAHDVPQNSACDLSAAVVGVLLGQPARQ